MSAFHAMIQKISSSSHYDSMQRTAKLLDDHFGINHFWYFRITLDGEYCFLGTHTKWTEFAFQNSLVQHFPCLRHPESLQNGINLMKGGSDSSYKNVLKLAWDSFSINFSINLMKKIPQGIEAFGFATRHGDSQADERLLNELPLLRQFSRFFREKHQRLFDLLYDNQVNIATHFGPLFYAVPKSVSIPVAREHLLEKLGLHWVNSLTSREKDVLQLFSTGQPASHIAQQMELSPRTVETYIANLKDKLCCSNKSELIQKAIVYVSLFI